MTTSRLERQIDSWIRWYPKWWRDANGAAIRGALLDQAEATGSIRLRFADRIALATAGMSVREARRSRLVSIAAGTGFVVLAVVYAVGISWSPNFEGAGGVLGFSNPSVISFAIGAVAVVLAVCAFPRLALGFAAGAVLLQAAFAIASVALGWQGPSVSMLVVFGGLLALATLPLQRRRTLALALVAVVALAFAAQMLILVGVPFIADLLG